MVILTSGSSQAHIKMYIGIDLGGTKTESIILDNKGNAFCLIVYLIIIFDSSQILFFIKFSLIDN